MRPFFARAIVLTVVAGHFVSLPAVAQEQPPAHVSLATPRGEQPSAAPAASGTYGMAPQMTCVPMGDETCDAVPSFRGNTSPFGELDLTISPYFGFAFVRTNYSNNFFQGFGNPESLDYGLEFVPKLNINFTKPPKPKYECEGGQAADNSVLIAGYERMRFTGNSAFTSTAGGTNNDTSVSNQLTIDNVDLVWVPLFASGDADGSRILFMLSRQDNPATLDFGLSLRYLGLSQEYASTVRAGAAVTQLNATQTINGFGVGARTYFERPMFADSRQFQLDLYGFASGAVLYGTNTFTSTFRGPGAQPASLNLQENQYIPVGNVELGLQLKPKKENKYGAYFSLVSLRAALYGTAWGDVAPISAAPNAAGSSKGDLFLYGAIVWIQINFGESTDSSQPKRWLSYN